MVFQRYDYRIRCRARRPGMLFCEPGHVGALGGGFSRPTLGEHFAGAPILDSKDGCGSFGLRAPERNFRASTKKRQFALGLGATVFLLIIGFFNHNFAVLSQNPDARNQQRKLNSALEIVASRICEQPVGGIAFTPDSEGVILCAPGECKAIALSTGKRLMRIGVPRPTAGAARSYFAGGVAVGEEGQIVVSHADDMIRVFNKTSGEPETNVFFRPLGETFPNLWFSSLSTCLVGRAPTQVRIWDLGSGDERGRYDICTIAMDMNRNGHDVVTIENDHRVRVWNLWNGDTRVEFLDQTKSFNRVKFYSDGLLICWDSSGTQFQLVDPYNPSDFLTFHHAGSIKDVTPFPNDPLIVSGGADNTLSIWNTDTRRLHEVRCPGEVERVAISPDGRYAVVAMTNRVIVYRVDVQRIRSDLNFADRHQSRP